MLVANDETIMGERVNGFWTNALGWLITAVMFAAAIGLVLVISVFSVTLQQS
jgi:Mn2+/Fe2+ NRAMP family transporter